MGEDTENAIATATDSISTLKDEIKDLMAENGAAKELLGFAKNRLNKFYNPKLHKAPPKQELSEQDRIVVNMGGEAPPTDAPGGIAGTGISALVQIFAHKQHKDAP